MGQKRSGLQYMWSPQLSWEITDVMMTNISDGHQRGDREKEDVPSAFPKVTSELKEDKGD